MSKNQVMSMFLTSAMGIAIIGLILVLIVPELHPISYMLAAWGTTLSCCVFGAADGKQ